MPSSEDSCAICGSTWGAVREEVDGVRRFFCCEVCAIQFREVVAAVKERTGWSQVEQLTFVGDRRGRIGTATNNGRDYRFSVAFNSLGSIRRFLPAEAGGPPPALGVDPAGGAERPASGFSSAGARSPG